MVWGRPWLRRPRTLPGSHGPGLGGGQGEGAPSDPPPREPRHAPAAGERAARCLPPGGAAGDRGRGVGVARASRAVVSGGQGEARDVRAARARHCREETVMPTKRCGGCKRRIGHLPDHNGLRTYCGPACRVAVNQAAVRQREREARPFLAPLPPAKGRCLYCRGVLPAGREFCCSGHCSARLRGERLREAVRRMAPPRACVCGDCGKRWKTPFRAGTPPRFCARCIGEHRRAAGRAYRLRKRKAARAAGVPRAA